jgi:hypothetical protein
MDLEEGRDGFHSYVYWEEEGGEGAEDEPLEGAGRNDQAEDGSLYKSRREGGEVIAWMSMGCRQYLVLALSRNPSLTSKPRHVVSADSLSALLSSTLLSLHAIFRG